jgi:uncharacterized phage protein (TIGR01671 family)
MSRELKFRAWDDVPNKDFPNRKPMMHDWDYVKMWSPQDWECSGVTIEQWTGLKDRHGREVYEGDIVTEIWCGEERSTSIVERDAPNGGFNLRDLDGEYAEIDSNHEFNIIGNVHENPELLQ